MVHSLHGRILRHLSPRLCSVRLPRRLVLYIQPQLLLPWMILVFDRQEPSVINMVLSPFYWVDRMSQWVRMAVPTQRLLLQALSALWLMQGLWSMPWATWMDVLL